MHGFASLGFAFGMDEGWDYGVRLAGTGNEMEEGGRFVAPTAAHTLHREKQKVEKRGKGTGKTTGG